MITFAKFPTFRPFHIEWKCQVIPKEYKRFLDKVEWTEQFKLPCNVAISIFSQIRCFELGQVTDFRDDIFCSFQVFGTSSKIKVFCRHTFMNFGPKYDHYLYLVILVLILLCNYQKLTNQLKVQTVSPQTL